MNTAVLETNALTKKYKHTTALDHVSLRLEKGEIYGFIGQNGAGKTTTIKAVVGILDFEEGEIRIDGHSVKEEPLVCKSLLAYIPDNPDLYEHLTGIQYLDFIADIFQIPSAVRTERIGEYAEQFGITESLGDLISSYSHGMKQKLAIISALIHKPRLLVLDEPFVGLDPSASVVLKQNMHALCEEGSAIFFSTHVLDVAEKLCNKIAIIKEGVLVAAGETAGLTQGKSLEEVFMEVVRHD